jgi:hypothetical protein
MKRPYVKKLEKAIEERLIYITALRQQLVQEEEAVQADIKELRTYKTENEKKLKKTVDERLIYITALRQQLIQEEEAVKADIKELRDYKIENEIKYLNSFITA